MMPVTGLDFTTAASYSFAFSATTGIVTSGRRAYAKSYRGPVTLMTSFGHRATPGVNVAGTGTLITDLLLS